MILHEDSPLKTLKLQLKDVENSRSRTLLVFCRGGSTGIVVQGYPAVLDSKLRVSSLFLRLIESKIRFDIVVPKWFRER